MNYLSLFTGAGGFDMGFHTQGFNCVGMAEINPRAADVAAKLSGAPNLGDVTKINPADVSECQVLIGGSPCQDLSIANRNRKGLQGDKSSLFYEYTRIAFALFDRGDLELCVWENVAGCLHSNRGDDFRQVLLCFLERGLHVAYRVLDGKYFGVPQQRRRVFLIASRRALGPAPSFLCDYPAPGGLLFATSENDGLEHPAEETCLAQVARKPERSGRSELMHDSFIAALLGHPTREDLPRSSVAIKTQRPGNDMHPDYMMLTQDGSGYCLRWRTPLESERLMGWPDNWTKYGKSGTQMSDSARYMMCGNGVIRQQGEFVARHVREILEAHA